MRQRELWLQRKVIGFALLIKWPVLIFVIPAYAGILVFFCVPERPITGLLRGTLMSVLISFFLILTESQELREKNHTLSGNICE